MTSPLTAVAGALLDSDDIKGVVISAPDGEIVKVGESYATGEQTPPKQDDSEVVEAPVETQSPPVTNRIEIPTAGA